MSTATYPQPDDAKHIISYDNSERKWFARQGNGEYGPAEVIPLFNTQKCGTAKSERSRYIVLFEKNGINTKIILVCDRHKVFQTNYSIPFYQVKKKLQTLFVDKWIGLDEEFKYDDYVDDQNLSNAELFKKKLGDRPIINYDPNKLKSFYVYYRPSFKKGPLLTFDEVIKALKLNFASIDCNSSLYLEYVMPSEIKVHSTLSFKTMKNKEDHYVIIHTQEFDTVEEATFFYSVFDLPNRNIDFYDPEEIAELKKLEGSKPSTNNSSSVLQSDKGNTQKQEVEAETEFNREKIISELRQGKVVKLLTSFIEEVELYQVRQLENKEYDSILEAVKQEKASPIEVFIDEKDRIYIIDGYTRRKAAIASIKPLAAFLSSANTKEEAEARAFQANTGRGNLSVFEEACFIEKFREKYTIKNDIDLAHKLSKPRDIISRRRKFAAATSKIQDLYSAGMITLLQTEAIGSITPLDQQRAYEEDWFDNRGKMTRNHPKGKVTVISVSYSEKNYLTKKRLIPHFRYVLELSNKKIIDVYSRTNTDFAKLLKKGEVISETDDYLEILCKSMTDSLKMPKAICESWPSVDELTPKEEVKIETEKEEVKIETEKEEIEVIKESEVKVDQIYLIGSNEQEIHYRVHLTNDSLYDLFSEFGSHCIITDLYNQQEEGETIKELFFDSVNIGEINFTMVNAGCVFCYPLKSQLVVDVPFYSEPFNELAEKIPDLTDDNLIEIHKALKLLNGLVVNVLKSRLSLKSLKEKVTIDLPDAEFFFERFGSGFKQTKEGSDAERRTK